MSEPQSSPAGGAALTGRGPTETLTGPIPTETLTGRGPATSLSATRALVTAVVAGLELSWLFALLQTAVRGFKFELWAPTLLALYAASFVVGFGLQRTRHSPFIFNLVSWLVWPFATVGLLLLLLPPHSAPGANPTSTTFLARLFSGIAHSPAQAAFIVAAGGFLWWLGARLASRHLTYETVLSEFQVGLLLLAALIFIGYAAGLDQWSAASAAVVFVGIGLVGAAATRGERGGPQTGRLLFGRSGTWWGMLFLAVSIVLLLGLLVGLIFTPDLIHLLIRGIRGLWHLFERLLSAIASLFPSSNPEGELPPMPQVPGGENQPDSSWTIPESWLRPSRIAYGVFMAGLALALVWRLTSYFFAWVRRRTEQGDVKIESLRSGFRLDLAKLLHRVIRWAKALAAFAAPRRTTGGAPTHVLLVRRIYVEMLRWGARSGFGRAPWQTPLEYQQMLGMALPQYQSEVILITQSFVRAQYGAETLNEEELDQLKACRRQLRRKARRRQGNRKASHGEANA